MCDSEEATKIFDKMVEDKNGGSCDLDSSNGSQRSSFADRWVAVRGVLVIYFKKFEIWSEQEFKEILFCLNI